jgi:phosphate:Na+ symporter
MTATEVILQLTGGVALLLWGLRMVRTGVMRAYGSALRRSLGDALGNRFAAAGAGIGVTVLLQSSTATAMLAGSFASRGLIATAPALAVMLGADIGTTLVAQILSFGFHALAPLLILIGVVIFSTGRASRRRDIGRALIGLGLMILALRLIVGSSETLRGAQAVQAILAALGGETMVAVLIAALLTWLAHSSLAIVLLIISLADGGVIGPVLALALVLGANLGGAIAPFVAALDQPPPGRRVPLGNLLMKAAGVVVVAPFLGLAAPWIGAIDPEPGRQAANFHTAFNVGIAVVFILLTGAVGRLCERLLPDPPAETDPAKPRHLDLAAIDVPTVAISCAARETMRMADAIETMLKRTIEVLGDGDRKLVAEIERMDNVVDRLHEAIKLYLTDITRRESLGDADARRWSDIMAFTTNLEHVGDIIDKNLMELAAKRIKNNYRFSAEGMAEISELHAQVLENLRLAMSVFMSGDKAVARRLLAEKTRFRDRERQCAENHIERLRQGKLESIETSALHLDVLRDLKRINSHITSVAYPILEQAGELADSRLRQTEDEPATSAHGSAR